jgi:hypothetical protein
MVSGLNGAVSVTCRPMAQRGLVAAAVQRADFVAADRPTTITEVALDGRAQSRSRMARLTPG